jgi:hypothetical protein
VDPLAAFRDTERHTNVYFSAGDMHYRAIGHQLSASALAEGLSAAVSSVPVAAEGSQLAW